MECSKQWWRVEIIITKAVQNSKKHGKNVRYIDSTYQLNLAEIYLNCWSLIWFYLKQNVEVLLFYMHLLLLLCIGDIPNSLYKLDPHLSKFSLALLHQIIVLRLFFLSLEESSDLLNFSPLNFHYIYHAWNYVWI